MCPVRAFLMPRPATLIGHAGVENCISRGFQPSPQQRDCVERPTPSVPSITISFRVWLDTDTRQRRTVEFRFLHLAGLPFL